MSPAIMNQAKLVGIALAAGLAWTAFASGTALAASGSERECDELGGTYTKDGPNAICVEPETTKDVNGKALGTATQTTTTGQGNINPQPGEETCEGNQGQCKQQ